MLFMVLASKSADAQIFKWIDDKGKVHFTDKPPKQVDAKAQDADIPEKTGNSLATPSQRNATRAHLYQKGREQSTPVNPQQPAMQNTRSQDKCWPKYAMTCAEVEAEFQANLEKCIKNRGGDRCYEKDYQEKRLMPLTLEQQRDLAEAQAGIQKRREDYWNNQRIRGFQ